MTNDLTVLENQIQFIVSHLCNNSFQGIHLKFPQIISILKSSLEYYNVLFENNYRASISPRQEEESAFVFKNIYGDYKFLGTNTSLKLKMALDAPEKHGFDVIITYNLHNTLIIILYCIIYLGI